MRSGSLRERGKGRWQYRASFGSHPDGRPRTRSATFTAANKTAADRKARQIRAKWDGEETATIATKGTVGALVARWVATTPKGPRSPTTEYRNRAIVNTITADLGRVLLSNLTAYDLDAWYMKLSQTRSPNTVHHYHRVMHAILRQGVKWKEVGYNVAHDASPPTRDKKKAQQLERMPTRAALEVMMRSANRSVRMAVLLAAATGARRGEIVGLRWSDIDGSVLTIQRSLYKLPGGVLGEKDTKTLIHPRVPLNPLLLVALREYHAENAAYAAQRGTTLVDGGPILAHLRKDPTGATPFAPDWLSQEWERLCKRSGVAPFKLHGTRHLHITELHDAGASSAAIAARVGHASIATTEGHYMHALPAASLELAAVVDNVFESLFTQPA